MLASHHSMRAASTLIDVDFDVTVNGLVNEIILKACYDYDGCGRLGSLCSLQDSHSLSNVTLLAS